MARLEKSAYRLVKGSHRVPNPDFVQDKSEPEESHRIAQVGDVVMLTEDQYKSFKDKFRPVDSDAAGVKDDDEETMKKARALAEQTGQMVDPNKPLAGQTTPKAAATATVAKT